jgi:hypothetical protein
MPADIYTGLATTKDCIKINPQQADNVKQMANKQWKALITLHQTLLHEHHDFFMDNQHPPSSPALKRLANKYAVPARMWRHGIHPPSSQKSWKIHPPAQSLAYRQG